MYWGVKRTRNEKLALLPLYGVVFGSIFLEKQGVLSTDFQTFFLMLAIAGILFLTARAGFRDHNKPTGIVSAILAVNAIFLAFSYLI